MLTPKNINLPLPEIHMNFERNFCMALLLYKVPTDENMFTFSQSKIKRLIPLFFSHSGQTEHRFKDGTVEVHFPNGSVRITNPYKLKSDGITEEWKYPDGTSVIQKTNGDKLLLLPNGQREVHTNGHKRREYPDGTVKIVYPDGSQESRYSNGRVRLKDKDGKLVMDSETIFV